MQYSQIDDWSKIPTGADIDNTSVKSGDHKNIYADMTYVNVLPHIARLSLLTFESSPVTQKLLVASQDPLTFSSIGLTAKIALVERAVVNIEKSAALGAAAIIIAASFDENAEQVRNALKAVGLEVRRV